MIKTKRGVGYAKSREFIEVQVSRSDDYESVIKNAMGVIRLEENGDEADLSHSFDRIEPSFPIKR